MTLEEKASLLSGKNFWQTRGIERLEIPQMSLADGPHGLRKQASEGDHLGLVDGVKATCFPTSATMANSWDEAICEEVGQALGKEAYHHEVNILLGPGLNIKRNPLCGRNFEYFSEDPYLSGKLASAYVNGIQKEGVGACLKHYAANNQESLRMTNDSVIDDRTLHEIYLTGFEIAVKESKPKAVMSAYNLINGTYASENKYLMRDVLVDQWGFEGMVVSDWGGSNDAVAGVEAGSHLEMPTPGRDSIDLLVEAVKNDKIEENVIDQRVEEYLRVLYETRTEGNQTLDYNKHHQLARKAAESAIVLLKNKDGVLPLKKNTKVAIIGDFADNPRYQGAGSSLVNAYKLENTLNVLGNTDVEMVGYAKGYNRIGDKDTSLISEAIQLAERVDVALLFIGLNEVNETEGRDRDHIDISKNQKELVKAVAKVAKKTVAVISSGSVIEMSWADECDGILHGYLSGQAGASAMINVLTGKVNPSGKLSETYPFTYDQCPNVSYYPGKEKTSEYREGLYVGYRYYDKADIEVRYPFGYGMSYTTFEYSNLMIEKNKVQFDISNTGSRAGAEIAQLYIGKEQDKIHRPVKEMKGFKKVFLEPGETRKVSIPFDEYSFRFYDAKRKKYAVEKGVYQIFVGSSSHHLHLEGTIEKDGIEFIPDMEKCMDKYFDGNVTDISNDEFQRMLGRPVPASKWDRSLPLDMNDSLSQMIYAKSLIARLAIKILIGLREKSYRKGKPDLNLFFQSNMPFRAMAKMSNGNFTLEMTQHLLKIVNGHFLKGMVGLVKSYFKARKKGNI